MLRRKGEVYQNVLRMVPRASSRGHRTSTLVTASPLTTQPSFATGTKTISAIPPPPRTRTRIRIRPPASVAVVSSPLHYHQFSHSKPDSNWIHRSYHSARQHHLVRPSTIKRFRSTYDPELAACMERWVRIVMMGQRRPQSSLAKPAFNNSGPSYTVTDIDTSGTTLSRDRSRNIGPQDTFASLDPFSPPTKTTIPASTSSAATTVTLGTSSMMAMRNTTPTTTAPSPTLNLAHFLQSLDRIPIQDHELPKLFRSSHSDASTRKPTLSRVNRRAIDRIWNDYLTLMTKKDGTAQQLTRRDYTKLMRIIRHSDGSQLASSRILALQQDMDQSGIPMNRKLIEMVAQAHLVLGSVSGSIQLYREATELVGLGTAEHRRFVWTMVDGFAANSLEIEGIAFLDDLPALATSAEDRSFYYSLYQRLSSSTEGLLRSFGSSATSFCSPRSITSMEQLLRYPLPPRLNSVAGTLGIFRKDDQRQGLVRGFSQMMAGLLIKIGDTGIMTLLLQSLLQERQLHEANRVLELMLRHGLKPELGDIRRHLVCSEVVSESDRKDLESVLEQWDAISTLRTKHFSDTLTSLGRESEFLRMEATRTIIEGYSDILAHCLREDDLPGALRTAKFMAARNWSGASVRIDFRRLNSQMVNFGRSETYLDYLRVRYILGGPSEPDLHTYRRLIYAACRRSDLFSALTLFKQVRTKHPSWTLDTTLYNAIISTAGATGQIRVAEKTFACVLEDGLTPDYYSFHALLNGYGHSGDLEAAVLIPEQMVKHKLCPNTKTFNLIMKAYLGTRGDMTTSRKLFQVMQRSGKAVPPDLVTFNQLLEGYRRAGNLSWFDAYFDRYFGHQKTSAVTSSSVSYSTAPTDARHIAPEPPAASSVCATGNPSLQSKRKKGVSRAAWENVKPEKTDDKTLLIQLKHSLLLTTVDVATVWELWHALLPRLAPASILDSSAGVSPESSSKIGPTMAAGMHGTTSTTIATATSTTSTTKTTAPSELDTYVPFRRLVGGVTMTATTFDHFRFTTLSLFRSAFLSRGETKGVRRVDRLVARLFPDHPAAQKSFSRQSGVRRDDPAFTALNNKESKA
ncbi:MAG: hypothetical protein J3R72DRAFT_463337 [Linnemannia gamsii]|nr:MAG: hypothetical protein J3R72DRAFT_463337 [Linnemannia gamsii]